MTGRMDRMLDGVQHLTERLAERRAAAHAAADAAGNPNDPLGAPTPDADQAVGPGPAAASGASGAATAPPRVPPPPGYAPAVVPPPPSYAVIPWGIRVAAEAGWRLLILAGVVYVLMKVVSALSLLVIAFSAGLLITALMQPTVARLKRVGLAPRPGDAADVHHRDRHHGTGRLVRGLAGDG